MFWTTSKADEDGISGHVLAAGRVSHHSFDGMERTYPGEAERVTMGIVWKRRPKMIYRLMWVRECDEAVGTRDGW